MKSVNVLKTDKILKSYVDAVEKLIAFCPQKTKPMVSRCVDTCRKDGIAARAYYVSKTNEIFVCADALDDSQEDFTLLKQSLLHELIHAHDNCDRPFPPQRKCKEYLCSEARAISGSGDCSQKNYDERMDCIMGGVEKYLRDGPCKSVNKQDRIDIVGEIMASQSCVCRKPNVPAGGLPPQAG